MTQARARLDIGGDLLRDTLRKATAGILFAGLVGLFVNSLHLAVPVYMLLVYDRVISSRSFDTLTMLTLLAVGCLAFLALLDFIRARTFLIIGEQIARRLNATVLQASLTESLRSQSPQAANGMRDLHELRQFVSSGPIAVPFDAAFAPLFLAVLFVMHPAYGVVALIAIVLLTLLGVAMEYIARRPSALANEAALRSNAEIGSAIRNAEVIEAMGMLPAVTRRWRQGQNRALALVGAGNSGAKALAAASRSVRMGVQVMMLATGAVLVIDQSVSAGSIIAATIIMGRLLFPFEQLIDGWRQWSNVISAVARLRGILSPQAATRGSVGYTASEGRLAVDRVSFVPLGSDRPVLKGVSFALEPGEILGVIGPSGAGKSTLARLLVGIWRPTAGGIFLDGHNVYAWERESFGRQVGYLPQNAALLDGTVRENIARLADADPAEVVAAAKRADVHEMIGRLPLGYETHIGEGGFVLSGGQRQRVALARALFGSPRLVVLDEPNSNLDSAGEQALLQTIREAKKAGVTIVLVAHRMSAMSVADKLLVLRDGSVDHFGARNDVIKAMSTQTSVTGADPKIARLPVERSTRS